MQCKSVLFVVLQPATGGGGWGVFQLIQWLELLPHSKKVIQGIALPLAKAWIGSDKDIKNITITITFSNEF